MSKIDMIGKRFGRLVVFSENPNRTASRDVQWNCRCDCGNLFVASGRTLRSGGTQSCGCLQKELLAKRNSVHGFCSRGSRRPRLYRIWCAMKTRCSNPHTKDWNNYGGRGITVCKEWANDFSAFHDWAISHGYDDSLTIDRENNDLGYSPQNCRWVTRKVQNNNTRATQRRGRRNRDRIV